MFILDYTIGKVLRNDSDFRAITMTVHAIVHLEQNSVIYLIGLTFKWPPKNIGLKTVVRADMDG